MMQAKINIEHILLQFWADDRLSVFNIFKRHTLAGIPALLAWDPFLKKIPLAGLFSFYGNSTCWVSRHVLIHHALPPLSALLIKMVISQSDSSYYLIRFASCSTHGDLCLAFFPQTENEAHVCFSNSWVLKTPVEWQKTIKLNTPAVPPHWAYAAEMVFHVKLSSCL